MLKVLSLFAFIVTNFTRRYVIAMYIGCQHVVKMLVELYVRLSFNDMRLFSNVELNCVELKYNSPHAITRKSLSEIVRFSKSKICKYISESTFQNHFWLMFSFCTGFPTGEENMCLCVGEGLSQYNGGVWGLLRNGKYVVNTYSLVV